MGSTGKKHCSWWCAIFGEKYEWSAQQVTGVTNRCQCQSGKGFHAAPQGLCENSINALKLLANQQKDGDSPIQCIVTGLCERSRKGIMEGLRNFVTVDNNCALDVGHLNEGFRSLRYEDQSSKRSVPRRQSGKVPRN